MKLKIYESGKPSNYIKIDHLKKPNLPAVVTFHRSESNAKGNDKEGRKCEFNYGKKDTDYNGEFGFDRFDNEVMAKGLANSYYRLDDVETKRKTTRNCYSYLCPYLSLYPPSFEGNVNGEKSTAELFVRLEEDKDNSEGKSPDFGAIYFISSDSAIEVEGSIEYDVLKKNTLKAKYRNKKAKKVSLKIGNALGTIKIKCNNAFDEKVFVDAITSKGQVIGRLIVVPNNKVYKLTIQPVYVKFGVKDDTMFEKTKVVGDTDFNKLKDKLNNQSLNQALITSEVNDPHIFTVKKSDFMASFEKKKVEGKDKIIELYNGKLKSEVTDKYIAILNNKLNKNSKKNIIYDNSGIHEAMNTFKDALNKKFKYNKSGNYTQAQTIYESDKAAEKKLTFIMDSLQQEFQEFRACESKMLTELEKNNLSYESDEVIKLPNKIFYVFYYQGINFRYNDKTKNVNQCVLGRTNLNSNISYIYKDAFQEYGTIIHEIAHGLGLIHTFANDHVKNKIIVNGVHTEKHYEKHISFSEKTLMIKKYNFKKPKGNITTRAYQKLHDEYLDIKDIIQNGFIKIKNQNNYMRMYVKFNELISNINTTISYEQNIQNTNIQEDDIKEVNDIRVLKQQIKELNNQKGSALKDIDKYYFSKSNTQENYMDYKNFSSGSVNKNFEKKMFTKNQWDIMRQNETLIQIKTK